MAALAAAGCIGSSTANPDAARRIDAHAVDTRAPDAPAPDTDLPDAARVADLSCLGAAPAASAADPLVVGGKVFAIVHYDVSALAGVTVALRRTSDDGVLATSTTGDDGAFAISVASGGAAIDGYLLVDDGVHRPTYASFGAPITGAGDDALLIVADDAELGRWYADAGDTWSASKRTVVAAVTDCAHQSVAGATADVSPAPAHLVYYDATAKRWDPSLAASGNGFVIATGAAASVTITAHSGASNFPAHALVGHPGAITLAVVPPTT